MPFIKNVAKACQKQQQQQQQSKIGEKVAKLLKHKGALEARFAAPFGIKLINDNCSGAPAFERIRFC